MLVLLYLSMVMSICFASPGVLHTVLQIQNTKEQKKWPHYGLELLFEPACNLTKKGVFHRTRARIYLFLFALSGAGYVMSHKKLNLVGMLPL